MKKQTTFFTFNVFKKAILDTFIKLNPRTQLKNPVMFVVYVGAFFTTYVVIKDIYQFHHFSLFNFQITILAVDNCFICQFCEAIAEGQGKARADSLKKTRSEIIARKRVNGNEKKIAASELKVNDIVVCEAGDFIPGDGEVIEGIASVDESAITGESAPVIRESGGDKSSVTMGTRVISDRIVIKISASQGNTFLDKMILLIEGATRFKTPNEIALIILLSALTFVFLLAVVTLFPFSVYSANASGQKTLTDITTTILISLLVCLIPTTIGGLLSAIGISGMERLMKKNVLVTSGRAVEASGDVDVLLLDKTGTITYGNRMADAIYPAPGIDINHLATASFQASIPDETPEGKSIISFIKAEYGINEEQSKDLKMKFISFSATTRMSGIDYTKGGKKIAIRKGATESIKKYIT